MLKHFSVSRLSVSFRLFLRCQYNYVLMSQNRASDWLKISPRFCWAPSIQNRTSKFLVCRLKDTGRRYSTLESMLSKRQGKTRNKMCFHLFLTVCFCRGVAVRALITQ